MVKEDNLSVNAGTSETDRGFPVSRSGVNLPRSVPTEAEMGCAKGILSESGSHSASYVKDDEIQPTRGNLSEKGSDTGNSEDHPDNSIRKRQKNGNTEDRVDSVIQSGQSSGEDEAQTNTRRQRSGKDNPKLKKDCVERQAETLADFIVDTLTGKRNGQTKCPVERTLLKRVKVMLHHHEIFFKGMMKRLDITRDTDYGCFLDAAMQLFDGGKAVTWAKIITLYTFGGRLAMYCQETDMEDFCCRITEFLKKCACDFVAPYVRKVGGWDPSLCGSDNTREAIHLHWAVPQTKLCEEFPSDDDFESMAWQFLSWTAFCLGLVTVASFLFMHS